MGTGRAVLHLLTLLSTERLTDGGGFVGTDGVVGDPLTLSHQSPALDIVRLTLHLLLSSWLRHWLPDWV